MKKQSGITLIALIVTIIVLLLLAGITIALVIGDNGILTQATKAVIENKSATDQEEIAMAWTSIASDYWNAWSKNTSLPKSEVFTKENFEKYLEDRGTIDGETFKFDEDTEGISFKYTPNVNSEKTYSVTIDKDGKVTLDSLASMLTAANYGDKVNYVAKNGYSDWKIFYNNGTNVFLIASDLVDKTLVPSVMAKSTDASYPYSAYWGSVPTTMSETARQDALFGITETSYKLDSNYANSRCVSTLLDTENWKTFKDDEGYGKYVIGGPTVEMWMASWNAKGEKYNESGNTKYEILKTTNEESGYYIGVTSTSYFYKLATKSQVGYNDTLYFPYQEKNYQNTTGYWLASPAFFADVPGGVIMRVCWDGVIRPNANSLNTSTVRPVVALSSEVTGTQDENGVWQLSK